MVLYSLVLNSFFHYNEDPFNHTIKEMKRQEESKKMKYNIVSLVMKHSISTTHKNLRCRECMHSQPVLNRDSQQYGILKTLWLLINPAMVLPFHCNSPFQTCHILAMFGNKFGSNDWTDSFPCFYSKSCNMCKVVNFPSRPIC